MNAIIGPTDYPSIDAFLDARASGDGSRHTLTSYRHDLIGFARWFAEHVPTEPGFVPDAVTPTDVREFRDWLVHTANRKPATINRKLAALRVYFSFCKASGYRKDDLPTEGVKRVAEQPAGPRWFLKREVNGLIRAVERHGRGATRQRDLAIILTLGTAVRYSHGRDVMRGAQSIGNCARVTRVSIDAFMLNDWGIGTRSVAGFAASSMLGIGVPLLIVCIVAHE